jgi:hypothetical protein
MSEALPRMRELFFPHHLPNLIRAILSRPRLVMWLQIALVIYLMMFLAAPPAMAAPPNPLEALDRVDSTGYRISNYNVEYLIDQLSLDAPGQNMTSWFVKFVWDGYRYGIGAAALIIDLALGFGWLDYLSYPIEQTAEVLDKLLDQIPAARELLITLAIGWGLFRMWMGQAARGLMDMFGSMAAWGISAAFLVNPVTWLTGPEGVIPRTKEAGQQFSAQLVDPDAAVGEVEAADAAGSLAQQIATIFVRKPHQFVAYGGLSDGGGCEQTYDENLTSSGKDLANAMLKCWPDAETTIKNPSTVTLLTAVIIAVGSIILIGIAVLCSAVILYEVVNILIAGVQLVWELFRAVGPGGSYLGLLGQFWNVAESILAMLFVIMINALYLGVVTYTFDNWDESMITMFLVVDVILLVMIAVIVRHRAKIRKHFERMKERTRAQGKQAPVPQRLQSMGRGGFAAGVSTAAGSKVAYAAGRAGSRVARGAVGVGRRAGGMALAPARAATRTVSRPGFMAARLGSGMLHKAGIHDRASHRKIRGLAYSRGERKWRKKEAKRTEKRELRQERRVRGKHWTWGGGTRDVEQRATAGQERKLSAAPGGHGKRPQRRSSAKPGPEQEPRSPRRRSSSPSSRRQGSTDPASRSASPGPDSAKRSGRAQTSTSRPGDRKTAQPGAGGGGTSPKDRLNAKMRSRARSTGPRPQASRRLRQAGNRSRSTRA